MFFNEGLRFRAACLYAGFFFKMKYLWILFETRTVSTTGSRFCFTSICVDLIRDFHCWKKPNIQKKQQPINENKPMEQDQTSQLHKF
jgi:hypothetical protein